MSPFNGFAEAKEPELGEVAHLSLPLIPLDFLTILTGMNRFRAAKSYSLDSVSTS